jgi:hypothetical protein
MVIALKDQLGRFFDVTVYGPVVLQRFAFILCVESAMTSEGV